MFSSRKDLIALALAVGASAGVTFLLKYAGWSGTFMLFAFQILIIPLIANIADHRKFVVWQVCILSSVLCTLGMIWRVDPSPKLELVKVGFVFWAMGTILSSPAPVYWFLLRFDKSRRIILLIPVAVGVVVLFVLVKLITA